MVFSFYDLLYGVEWVLELTSDYTDLDIISYVLLSVPKYIVLPEN